MIAFVLGGILRAVGRIASTVGRLPRPARNLSALALAILPLFLLPSRPTLGNHSDRAEDRSTGSEELTAQQSPNSPPRPVSDEASEGAAYDATSGVYWGFGRRDDPTFQNVPTGWMRYEGRGYPKYLEIGLTAKNRELEIALTQMDAVLVKAWTGLKKRFSFLTPPLPPSITDLIVDRYLQVKLDGGQAKYQSPSVPANRMFQYRFSCSIMTQGLRHDSARAELVFMDSEGQELQVYSTPSLRGTNDWSLVTIDLVRPPADADHMAVRLRVDRGEDGIEDIRGIVGFDNIRIRPFPQLQISADRPLGVYQIGETIELKAEVLGLSNRDSQVRFRLFDSEGRETASEQLSVLAPPTEPESTLAASAPIPDSNAVWRLPQLEPGFYRVSGSIIGGKTGTLTTETTLAVIDESIGGPPHGSFGWTLPRANEGIAQRDLAIWLRDLGVAWVKYPCWLAPDDTAGAESTASILSKLQDLGIQTVGMLDQPPEDQINDYPLRGRDDLVASQLFRDVDTWQPRLEPVMTRLSLKVRTWQLGGERDFSFLGRPRLSESIQQTASALRGFGQPIDVVISWPWLEKELRPGDSSWQAVCRSSDPPLGVRELDAYLAQRDEQFAGQGPRTWLLIDPISKSRYSRKDRIVDLVMRMATARSHRVQAAFISDPRDPEHGLLQPDGRPDELLLPWRTTSRLIGDLKREGQLQLRSGAENMVFSGPDRTVLMVWSPEPKEEQIYLGEHVKMVDVWGQVSQLDKEVVDNQIVQRIPIGPVPTFIIHVDPALLAFRMSVDLNPKAIDSLLGIKQPMTLSFANPTSRSLMGQFWVKSPDTWSIDTSVQDWEVLAGNSASHEFDVVLGNTSRIGPCEIPIQFQVETVPPQVITVYKHVTVGPEDLDLDVTTRLLSDGDLRVQIEMTNRGATPQFYDCLLFPSANRQYQQRSIAIPPGETIRRAFHWPDGEALIGRRMLLRADEKDGPRVFNHSFEVTR